jgi:predicted nucleic acid-binding protein
VLDSTAIAALFFEDPYSDSIEKTLKTFDKFYTLDLAFAEVCNVAWKRIRLFKEDYTVTSRALSEATDFVQNVCHVTESREILGSSLELGVKHDIGVYDCLFLALAKRLKLRLLTTDEKLHKKLTASKELANLTLLP